MEVKQEADAAAPGNDWAPDRQQLLQRFKDLKMPTLAFNEAMRRVDQLPRFDKSRYRKRKNVVVEDAQVERDKEIKQKLNSYLSGLDECYSRCVSGQAGGTKRTTRDTPPKGTKRKKNPALMRNTVYFTKDPRTGVEDPEALNFTNLKARLRQLAQEHLKPHCVVIPPPARLSADIQELKDDPVKLLEVLAKLEAQREAARKSLMDNDSRTLYAVCEAGLATTMDSTKRAMGAAIEATVKAAFRSTMRELLDVGKDTVMSPLGAQALGKSTMLSVMLEQHLDMGIYRTEPFPNDLVLLWPVLKLIREKLGGEAVDLLNDPQLLKIAMPLSYGADVETHVYNRYRTQWKEFCENCKLPNDMSTFAPAGYGEGKPTTNIPIMYAYYDYVVVMMMLKSLEEVLEEMRPLLSDLNDTFAAEVAEAEKEGRSAEDVQQEWRQPDPDNNMRPLWASYAEHPGDGSVDQSKQSYTVMLKAYWELCGDELPWCRDADSGRLMLSTDAPLDPKLRALLEGPRYIALTGPRRSSEQPAEADAIRAAAADEDGAAAAADLEGAAAAAGLAGPSAPPPALGAMPEGAAGPSAPPPAAGAAAAPLPNHPKNLPDDVLVFLLDIISLLQGVATESAQAWLHREFAKSPQTAALCEAAALCNSWSNSCKLLAAGQRLLDLNGCGTLEEEHDAIIADSLTNTVNLLLVLTENGLKGSRSTLEQLKLYIQQMVQEVLAAEAARAAGTAGAVGQGAGAGPSTSAAPQLQAAAAGAAVGAGLGAGHRAAAGPSRSAAVASAVAGSGGGGGGFTATPTRRRVVLVNLGDCKGRNLRGAIDLQQHLAEAKEKDLRSLINTCGVWSEVATRTAKQVLADAEGKDVRKVIIPPCVAEGVIKPKTATFCPILGFSLTLNAEMRKRLDEAAAASEEAAASKLPSANDLLEYANHQFVLQQLVAAPRKVLLEQVDSILEVLDELSEIPGLGRLLADAAGDAAPPPISRSRRLTSDQKFAIDSHLKPATDCLNGLDAAFTRLAERAEQLVQNAMGGVLPPESSDEEEDDEQPSASASRGASSGARSARQAPRCKTVVSNFLRAHSHKVSTAHDVRAFLNPSNHGKHPECNIYAVVKALCQPVEEAFPKINRDVESCIAAFIQPPQSLGSGAGAKAGVAKAIASAACKYYQQAVMAGKVDACTQMDALIGTKYEARVARLLGEMLRQVQLDVLAQLGERLTRSLEQHMDVMLQRVVEAVERTAEEDRVDVGAMLQDGVADLLHSVVKDLSDQFFKDLLKACFARIKSHVGDAKAATLTTDKPGLLLMVFRGVVCELDSARREAAKEAAKIAAKEAAKEAAKAAAAEAAEEATEDAAEEAAEDAAEEAAKPGGREGKGGKEGKLNALKLWLEAFKKRVESPERGEFAAVEAEEQRPIRIYQEGLRLTRHSILGRSEDGGLGAEKLPHGKAWPYFQKLAVTRPAHPTIKAWGVQRGSSKTGTLLAYKALDAALKDYRLKRAGVARDGDRLVHALLVGLTGSLETPGSAESIEELRMHGAVAAMKLASKDDGGFGEALDNFLETDNSGRHDKSRTDWLLNSQQPGDGADYFLLQGIVQAQRIRVVVWLLPSHADASKEATGAGNGSAVKTPQTRATKKRRLSAATPAEPAPVLSESAGPSGSQPASAGGGPVSMLLLEPTDAGPEEELPVYGIALVLSRSEAGAKTPGRPHNHVEAVVPIKPVAAKQAAKAIIIDDDEDEGEDGQPGGDGGGSDDGGGDDGGGAGGGAGGCGEGGSDDGGGGDGGGGTGGGGNDGGGSDGGGGIVAKGGSTGGGGGADVEMQEADGADTTSDGESVDEHQPRAGGEPLCDLQYPPPPLPSQQQDHQGQQQSAPARGPARPSRAQRKAALLQQGRYTPTGSVASSIASERITRSMAEERRLCIVLDPSVIRCPGAQQLLPELVQQIKDADRAWGASRVRVYMNRTLREHVEESRRLLGPVGLQQPLAAAEHSLYELLSRSAGYWGNDLHTSYDRWLSDLQSAADRARVPLTQRDMHMTLLYTRELFASIHLPPQRVLVLYWSSQNLARQLQQPPPGRGPSNGRWIHMANVANLVGAVRVGNPAAGVEPGNLVGWFLQTASGAQRGMWELPPHYYWISLLV